MSDARAYVFRSSLIIIMKVRTPLSSLTLRFSSLLLAVGLTAASAHEVWIEDTPEGKLFVRFAEFGDDFEKSPGHLDALGVPAAFVLSKEGKPATLNAKKETDGYVLVDAAAQSSAFVEAPFAVMGASDKAGRKPIFYARWHVGNEAAKPVLTFDIVPSGAPGVARVFLRGQPLADAKVTAFLPDGGEEELTSDKEGAIQLKVQKSGFYLLVSKHQRETQSGFHGGLAYEAVSHNCSLAWRQP